MTNSEKDSCGYPTSGPVAASANTRQVGGTHYRTEIQHWDYAAANGFDYFQGQITKYVSRWKSKNGLQDLHKARHFLDKYIEVETQKQTASQEHRLKSQIDNLQSQLKGSISDGEGHERDPRHRGG